MDIIKTKQIVTPTTDINIKKIPKNKNNKDCCQKIKDMWKIHEMRNTSALQEGQKGYDEKSGTPFHLVDWWVEKRIFYVHSSDEQRMKDLYDFYRPDGIANKNCEFFRWKLEGFASYYDGYEEYGEFLRIWDECLK
jgi:hypothetical protein